MKQKMKTKDLIYAGAFAALYIVIMFIIVMACGAVPILYLITPLLVGIVDGTVYLLYTTKVQKTGAILILAVLFGLVTSTNHITSLFIAMIAGIIAELIVRAGDYKSRKLYGISYLVFNISMCGPFTMLIIAKQQFIDSCIPYYGQEYADKLSAMTPNWIVLVLIGLAIVGAAIGVLIGNHFMKKHFEKAGIV
ncbi:MAG: MptD family putative ECF transporter S component [Lachnospiraceae bacterium]|nr:MptD family putative ECF transporter S component [Lachnospiraceae bacterium]